MPGPIGIVSGTRKAGATDRAAVKQLSAVSGSTIGYANPQLVCTPAELALKLALDRERPGKRSGGPLIVDLRPAEDFALGHIPGAVHLDLFGVSLIDSSPAPLRAFLWIIEHLLASRGVRQDRAVVVYDDKSGMRAARAFWFLEYFGHPDVQLLDGGFTAWREAGLPVTTETTPSEPSSWTGARDETRISDWRDVQERLGRPETLILDTRSDGEYFGEVVRAARGGAIPGAVHLEWTRNLDGRGAFKPAVELQAMYESAGVTPDREVVAYCHGGYRAAHSYLALRLLGYPKVRNYIGSWKEWGDREDLPIESPRR